MKTKTTLDRLTKTVTEELAAVGLQPDTPPPAGSAYLQTYRAGNGLIATLKKLPAQFETFDEAIKADTKSQVTSRPAQALIAAAYSAGIPLEELADAVTKARTQATDPAEVTAALKQLPRLVQEQKNGALAPLPKDETNPVPLDETKTTKKRSAKKPDQDSGGSAAQSTGENSEK